MPLHQLVLSRGRECSSTCWAQFSALKLCHGPFGLFSSFLLPAHSFWLVLAVGKQVRACPFGLFSSFLLPAHSFWLVLAVDKRVRPGPAREAKLLWLAAPSGPIALLHIEQAAGALLWFVPGIGKRCQTQAHMGMDRPGIEPSPSRVLSTTPTAPELSWPRVLNYLLGTAFSAEALSRPALSQPAPPRPRV